MDKTLFEELVGSLKEAKAIAKGRAKPSRRFEVTAPDAKAVRDGLVARRLCQAHAGECEDAAELGAAPAQPHGSGGGAAQDRVYGAGGGAEVTARLKRR